MRILEDSDWKQLTNHQKIRHVRVAMETTLKEIAEFVAALPGPFKIGDNRFTVRIERDVITVHCQLYN